MAAKEKATAIASSAPTDEKQSLNLCNNIIMSENSKKINQKNENTRIQFLFRQMNNPDYFNTVSLTELYDTVYQPKTQVIDNLLYAGVYLFAGAPKVGKSFFMAQIGYHVSKGIPLWNYTVHKGVSLYLALEDDYARLQKRLSKMFGMDGTDDFHFVTNAKNLSQGLESQLDTFIQGHPDTRLIIIDTLQKIREAGGEKFSYASDYEIVTKLKQFNAEHNVCILLVHHTRKQNADDCFDTISGTNGLLGAADGAFLMQKEKRTDNIAVLDLVGRDQQDQRLHLQFDRERCVWQLIKAETELWKEPPDPILSLISGLVNKEAPEWIGSATELIERLKLEMQPNVLTRRLNVGADWLWNEYGISYENTRSHTGRQVKFTLNGK
ncbi:MAG TPA: AAA family ATPase [Clostridiales bacterium]|nr:AAA family ATPase [Clostridiales bacterium]